MALSQTSYLIINQAIHAQGGTKPITPDAGRGSCLATAVADENGLERLDNGFQSEVVIYAAVRKGNPRRVGRMLKVLPRIRLILGLLKP